MTRPITLYTLRKEKVWADGPTDSLEFYEKQDNFLCSTSLHPYGKPMTATEALRVRRLTVPIHHYGRILPTGEREEERYALHPQIQEFIERELRRKKYLSDETVNNIRAEDSRVIQALSEEVRDLKEKLSFANARYEKSNERRIRFSHAMLYFVRAPLWRRLYVAIFSPRSIFLS